MMNEITNENIKIGISSCLLGENVRFDSGHKKNAYITAVLLDYFKFVPFCPEVKIGLGIPREPIRLVNIDDEVHCIGTKNRELDVTQALKNTAEEQRHWHGDLCGYILKKDSPSCGMARVKLYSNADSKSNHSTKDGVGIYAQRLMENFPFLPIEEEGRLTDAHLRENFIQRVYIYSRWRALCDEGLTWAGLQAFHANHKYIFMSHNQLKAKDLGALLADTKDTNIEQLAMTYLEQMTELLKIITSRKKHVNTLHHIQGYLKNSLEGDDKAELKELIEGYQKGLLPLIVPITLLRHHFRRHPNEYITNSFYMAPHPGEMMLLNNI
jgi:uncharacterized protein YbgA (DUF1722 family)/uncharacterized protein YbbK (DUF523 family)